MITDQLGYVDRQEILQIHYFEDLLLGSSQQNVLFVRPFTPSQAAYCS